MKSFYSRCNLTIHHSEHTKLSGENEIISAGDAAADVCHPASDETLTFTTRVNPEPYFRDCSSKSFSEQLVTPGESSSEGHYSAVSSPGEQTTFLERRLQGRFCIIIKVSTFWHARYQPSGARFSPNADEWRWPLESQIPPLILGNVWNHRCVCAKVTMTNILQKDGDIKMKWGNKVGREAVTLYQSDGGMM